MMPSSCFWKISNDPNSVLQKRCLYLVTTAAVAGRFVAHEVLFHQRVHRLLHHGLAQLQHRLAIGLLIAGIGEGIQRQGILIGSGDFLFKQAADHSRFVRGKFNVHVQLPSRRRLF